MTDPRRQTIIDVAFEVFMRHGYRGTTMEDIARQVGLSRPTLYLTFANKEAIFRAVVASGHEQILGEIQAGLSTKHSLAGQLEHAFEVWSVQPFDMVARSPAAKELTTSSFDFASDLFDGSSESLTALLAQVIRAAVTEPGTLQPSARDRARVLVAAAHGFKSTARDTQDMRRLIHDLVSMTVAGLPLPTSTCAR